MRCDLTKFLFFSITHEIIRFCIIHFLLQATDALEMLLLSFLAPMLRCNWMLSEYQVAFITTVSIFFSNINVWCEYIQSPFYAMFSVKKFTAIGWHSKLRNYMSWMFKEEIYSCIFWCYVRMKILLSRTIIVDWAYLTSDILLNNTHENAGIFVLETPFTLHYTSLKEERWTALFHPFFSP